MEDESTTRQALLEEISDLKKKIQEIEQAASAQKSEKPGQTDQHGQILETEEHYHALFQYSKDAILLTQPDGAILDANPAACEMFGRSLDEIQRVGRNGLVDLTDPRLHAALTERAKKSVVKAEITMLRANGEKFPAEMTSAVFIDGGGQRKTSMIIRDMTENHRIEQDYQSLFEQMLEGFMLNEIICDAQGRPVDYRFLKVNPAFERMTGMKAEQIIGRTVLEVLPESENLWIETYGRVALTGEPTTFENYSKVLAKHFVVTVFQPRPRQFACIFFDISDRKRAEEALLNASSYNRSLIEANLDPLVTIDPEGRIADVNSATEKVTGYLRQELTGTDFSEYFTEPEKARQGYQQAFREGMVRDYPLEIRHQDGHVTSVLYNATVYRDASGNICGVFASARDVTERRQAEEERARLEAVNRQLQKSASLGRMAGAIAHHFNNKLHVVMGHLELARESLAQVDICTNNLTAASMAADEAAEVSRMMLVYLGQVTGEQKPLDFSEVCQKGLAMLQVHMPHNVAVVTDIQVPGPIVTANGKQVRQILTNLVTNAWESGENDRDLAIHLTTRTIAATDIPNTYRFPVNWQANASDYACLEVQDNGCGMSKEDLEELFTPFFSTKFTGRGLGLPMVLGLVQAHNGVITVESSLGHGSIFRVFLPVSAEKLSQQLGKPDQMMGLRRAGKVLLVDDDEVILEITSMMLSRLGFSVLSAGDGIEAVELFRQFQNEICLVLSDVSMPRMDGWDTLGVLRQIAPEMPIILTSGYSEEQVMEGRHAEQPPQAFLAKPFGFEALRDAVCHALQDTTRFKSFCDSLENNGRQA